MWTWFFQLASPKWVYQFSNTLLPWFRVITLLLLLTGLTIGLLFSSEDYQQGQTVRILYIHVPAAFLSMFVYVLMAVSGGIGFIWRIKIAHVVSVSCAPIGAIFTLLTLITGSLWGKPTWGTYWEWDARMTSYLILLFLYLGFMALHNAFDDKKTADRAVSILALVGLVNIPIIHFSVEWWNTLHQGATISKFEKPSMDTDMLMALLTMILAFQFYFITVLLQRMKSEILNREKMSSWVRKIVLAESKQGQN